MACTTITSRRRVLTAMSVDLARDGDVATITIDNPEKKNAIDVDSAAALADHLFELAHDDGVRCVEVTGAGDAFCSGLDITASAAGGATEELERGFNAIARRILRMPKPVVATLPGPAVGAGASIASACDFVYAAESAWFQWKFTELGLVPDTGATYVLPRLVGPRLATELMVTARKMDVDEAVEEGVANEAIPDAEYGDVVAERLAMLASRPTKAVGATKRLALRNWHRSMEESLRAEAGAQEQMFQTEDATEGFTAFTEGREPEFEGR